MPPIERGSYFIVFRNEHPDEIVSVSNENILAEGLLAAGVDLENIQFIPETNPVIPVKPGGINNDSSYLPPQLIWIAEIPRGTHARFVHGQGDRRAVYTIEDWPKGKPYLNRTRDGYDPSYLSPGRWYELETIYQTAPLFPRGDPKSPPIRRSGFLPQTLSEEENASIPHAAIVVYDQDNNPVCTVTNKRPDTI